MEKHLHMRQSYTQLGIKKLKLSCVLKGIYQCHYSVKLMCWWSATIKRKNKSGQELVCEKA